MAKYECATCGHIYDPEGDDPYNRITQGVAFDDLPDDWLCPLCQAPKKRFKKID